MKKKTKEQTVADIPVLIFCGGRGTRIKEETELIPKPLVKIGGKPILWHIMKIYYAQGFRRFVLLLGYKGEKIKEYIHNYALYTKDFTLKHRPGSAHVKFHGASPESWEVTCIDTGQDTQTAARLKKASAHLGKAPLFMLTYGDGVADVDLDELLKNHRKHKTLVTMTGVRPPARFGEIIMDQGKVVAFDEKPEQTTMLINGGFFAVDPKVFKHIADDDALTFERHVLPELAKKGELSVMPHGGYWQCMDTIRDMELLNTEWNSGQAAWKIW